MRKPTLPCLTGIGFTLLLFSIISLGQADRKCSEGALVVSAIDAGGMPVENLDAADFRLSYRGSPVPLTSSQYREHPDVRVMVLLDLSGSMLGQTNSNKWRIAHEMASKFVSLAPPRVQITFIGFSDKVEQEFEASGGRQPIEEWLASSAVKEGQKVHGKTALFTAVAKAIRSFGPPSPGDVIYVITDAGDDASAETLSTVERSLLSSEIRLFTFVLREYGPPEKEGVAANIDALNELVQRSGGFPLTSSARPYAREGSGRYEFDAKAVSAAADATRFLQTQITHFYTLAFTEPNQANKSKDWKLEVVDRVGRKRNDIALSYSHPAVGCLP